MNPAYLDSLNVKTTAKNFSQGVSDPAELQHVLPFIQNIVCLGPHTEVFLLMNCIHWVTWINYVWWPWGGTHNITQDNMAVHNMYHPMWEWGEAQATEWYRCVYRRIKIVQKYVWVHDVLLFEKWNILSELWKKNRELKCKLLLSSEEQCTCLHCVPDSGINIPK